MSKVPPKTWLAYIQKVKNKLKTDPTIDDICRKYDMDPEDLDLAPIKFDDIDVSARTEKGVIILNWNLLKQENRDSICGYIIHEFNHLCQMHHTPTQSADDGDYLSNPFEQESFQFQLDYLDNQYGPDVAEKYVNQVLDHHGEEGKERQEKKEILLKKVEQFSSLCFTKQADKTSDLKNKYLSDFYEDK